MGPQANFHPIDWRPISAPFDVDAAIHFWLLHGTVPKHGCPFHGRFVGHRWVQPVNPQWPLKKSTGKTVYFLQNYSTFHVQLNSGRRFPLKVVRLANVFPLNL
jgi:hypothetical protein